MKHSFSKALSFVLAFAMLVSSCGVLAYADDCTHPATSIYEERVNSTCTEDGEIKYICSDCDAIVRTEVIPAAHTYVQEVKTEPVCGVSDGVMRYTCSVCNDPDVAYELPIKLDHDYEHLEVAPTCTEDGYEVNKCKNCGDEKDKVTADAKLGHDYSVFERSIEDPSCEGVGTDGRAVYKCSRCDAKQTKVVPFAHTYAEENIISSVAATCTAEGNVKYNCSVCDKEITIVVPALGHDIVTDAAVAATCTEDGKTEGKHCSRCDAETVSQTTVPATGHTEVDDAAVAAKCTEAGKTAGKHCSVCNEIIVAQTEVPATGHTEEIISSVPATCSATGRTEGKKCSVCDEVLVAFETIDKLAHTEVEDAAVAATCTENGLTAGKHCSVCHAVIKTQEAVPALGHNYVKSDALSTQPDCSTMTDGKDVSVCTVCDARVIRTVAAAHVWETAPFETEQPTCTADGSEKYKCTNEDCDEINTVVLDATGHTEVDDEAVAATCTETGLTAGKHCSVCDEVIVAQTDVPATGHTVVNDEAVAATCTETGLTAGKHCSVCDEVIEAQTVVEALGHDIVTDAAVEATCTEAGKTAGSHCSRCDDATVEGEVIPDLGHEFVNYVANGDATCAKNGTETASCSRPGCLATDTREDIDSKLPHTEVDDSAVAATCTTTGLTAGKHCSACHEVFTAQEIIPALGHDYAETSRTLPKCSTETNGAVYYKCTRCDGEKVTPIPYAHTWATESYETKEPTCTVDGYAKYRCTAESCTKEKIDVLKETGHTEVIDAAVAATCTEAGLTAGKHCSVCDEVLVAQTVVPAKGHTEVNDASVAPTCTKTGLTAGKHCSVCDAVLEAQVEVAALGHDIVTDAAVEATCIATGLTEGSHCSRCDDATVEQTETEMIAHELTKTDKVEKTCTVDGCEAYWTCSKCSKIFGDAEAETEVELDDLVIDAGHEYVDHEAQAVTCTEIGWDAYQTCSECDYTSYEEIAALGHDMKTVVVAPSCTVYGYTVHYCSRCITEEALENIDPDSIKIMPTEVLYLTDIGTNPAGHQYDEEGTVIKEAACTEAGVKQIACTVCDETINVRIDPIGHDYVNHDAKEVTCIEIGWAEYKTCSRCDYTTYVEIEALGHDYVDHDAKAATCTEIGWDEYKTCSRCDYTTYVEIEALGHTEAERAGTPATCSAKGVEAEVYCSVCDEILSGGEEIAIDPDAHKWVAGTVVAPTDLEQGYTEYSCEYCDAEKKDDYVDALAKIVFDYTVENYSIGANRDSAIDYSAMSILNSGYFTLTIKATAEELAVRGINLYVGYNKDVVEFIAYNNEGDFNSVDASDDIGSGEVGIAILNESGNVTIDGETILITLLFKVKDIVDSDAVIALTARVDSVFDADSEEITSATIAIAEKDIDRLGDVNGDGILKLADAVRIYDIVVANSALEEGVAPTYLSEADIDKDGTISMKDYALARKFFANRIDEAGFASETNLIAEEEFFIIDAGN